MTISADIKWPIKSRDIQNQHVDSTMWNGINFRDTDIVIATYPKSGTTWAQQIVAQLLFAGDEKINLSHHSHWVEFRAAKPERAANIEAQIHRRFFKTHLPVDALRFSPQAKYMYVGRDGRDVAWSLFNFYAKATDDYYRLFNDTPGRIGPPVQRPSGDARDFYRNWLQGKGFPTISFWETVRSWWSIRMLPNVKLFHFNDLKADLAGSVLSTAAFLDIPVRSRGFSKIVEHCSFDYMKAHAELSAPASGAFWTGGGKTFINKGTNGRWRETLSEAEIAAYEEKALTELGPACAAWLAKGSKA
jgi:aryl sulfotransferase